MADAPWKRTERRIARRLGGRRLGSLGRSAPDVIADGLSVEVKHRRRLPRWLTSALAQAEAAARETGRLPLLVLAHVQGRGRRTRRWAVLPLEVHSDERRGRKGVTPIETP